MIFTRSAGKLARNTCSPRSRRFARIRACNPYIQQSAQKRAHMRSSEMLVARCASCAAAPRCYLPVLTFQGRVTYAIARTIASSRRRYRLIIRPGKYRYTGSRSLHFRYIDIRPVNNSLALSVCARESGTRKHFLVR